MTRSKQAWILFFATRLVALAVDAFVVGTAYLAAFALRFDFCEPRWGWRAVGESFVTVLAAFILALLATGCWRLAWRRFALADVPRLVSATVLAAALLTGLRLFLPHDTFLHIRPPYSITVMTWFLASAGLVAVRAFWRAWCGSRRNEAKLLERDIRSFDNGIAARFLAGKTVLVTGAGGSIGSEIVRQVAAAGARRVLMVERGEHALYDIDRKMRGLGSTVCVPLLVDAGDAARMERLFADERPDVVLHAAAYKHVPMVELNPEEGWRNNVEVTKTLAELASRFGVKRFVLISTDKAVNPLSVMGKTKQAAEDVILSFGSQIADFKFQSGPPTSNLQPPTSDLQPPTSSLQPPTSFCAVRFGNVFGSSGSVVPLFREQIAAGGPVTVTHPDMRRFFMTVQEAVSLVLQAASRTERGIYTLDMGRDVRILDLAEDMIREAGRRPYVDIPIVFTGIRPGEKLVEELGLDGAGSYRTDMAKIYCSVPCGEGGRTARDPS